MKYLCLVYFEEPVLDAMNGPKRDALSREAPDHIDEPGARNHLLAAEAPTRPHSCLVASAMAGSRRPMVRLRKPRSNWAASF